MTGICRSYHSFIILIRANKTKLIIFLLMTFLFECSDFANIFDVNWFITYLAKDITIVKRVPDKIMRSMEKPPYTMRVPRKSEPEYYLDQVLPILSGRRVYLDTCLKFLNYFTGKCFDSVNDYHNEMLVVA